MLTLSRKSQKYIFFLFFGLIFAFVFDITFGPSFGEWFHRFDVHNEGEFLIYNTIFKAIPTFIGIIVGFWFDKWRSYISYIENVEKIAPLIEIELWENFKLVSKKVPMNIEKGDFHTEYWEIYKNDLSKWAYINVITLTEIYGLVKHYNKEDLNCLYRIRDNINYILKRYKHWYSLESNKSARREKENAIDKFEKLQLSTDQLEILIHLKKEIEDLKNQLKNKY